MNKKQVVANLKTIANQLDNNGLYNEANEVTEVMVRISQGLISGGSFGPSYNNNVPLGIDPALIPKTPETESIVPKKSKAKDEPKKFDSLPSLDIPMPYDKILGKPSKPFKSDSSTPKTTEGLDRWVNKAENIYNAWGQKGANPNSEAFELIIDIHEYMKKVKSNLPTALQSAADAKLKKVLDMAQDIIGGRYTATTTAPYSSVSGFPGKGADPFGTGQRIQGKELDYQAKQESKSY